MKKKLLICLAALVVIIIGAGLYIASLVFDRYDGETTVRVNIPDGSTREAVADSLTASLGADFARSVDRLWKWQGGTPEEAHGSYAVAPGTTALRLSRAIRYGRQTPVRLTFNNVRTLDALAERLSAKMEFSPGDFTAACDSVLPEFNFKPAQYPAAFLPDTYEVYWTDSAIKTVRKLVDVRNNFWNDERRAKARNLGLTPVGVATVASIVEEETAKADERPKVARLYLNRLATGMPLQADPTVKFAVGDFSLRRITGKHLKMASPYNTYINKGLPPGPIRIPDRKTLEGVLDAPQHDFLYMCAKSDFSGYHDFARTFADHRRNAARYQSELNKRGIK